MYILEKGRARGLSKNKWRAGEPRIYRGMATVFCELSIFFERLTAAASVRAYSDCESSRADTDAVRQFEAEQSRIGKLLERNGWRNTKRKPKRAFPRFHRRNWVPAD